MIHRLRHIALALIAGIAVTGTIGVAGDLNPPPGPVAPTHKTLTEVEPRIAINATTTPGDPDSLFKITQPGSYYLTGNITGVVGKHGVEIAASGVTLDLNGFELFGVAGSLDGVSTTVASLTNIAVVNGSVRSWSGDGVDLGTAARNCRVADLLANGNGANGIYANIGCSVSNCSTRGNATIGIGVFDYCTVSNCSAIENGVYGISAGSGCSILNCSASSNTGNGIITGTACTLSNCSAYSNNASGISAGGACIISNCSASDNIGIGISAGSRSMVSNCSAYQNTGSGFSVSNGISVIDCTAGINTLDGIVCNSSCIIRGNACAFNGGGDGAGVHATGLDNRIEGNNCTNADRGIDVDLAGNIIIRNTCTGNTTNWDIVANNVCGPILDRTAPASAAILGNSAPSSLGSTDANANFSY